MAGFFADTSGLDAQNVYGGTTNNAAADFDRLSGQNPAWFGGKNKKEAQHEALQKSVSAPVTPTPDNPTASPSPNAAPQLSSQSGLVKSVLQQIANPPKYDANGQQLVPGTPFTPQQFAQQLVQEVTPQIMNALAPPPEAMRMPPTEQQAGMPALAPYQGVPQFGATAEGPPRREQQSPFGGGTFGGNTFGGNTFGGSRFSGRQFGASAPRIPTNAAPGPMSTPQIEPQMSEPNVPGGTWDGETGDMSPMPNNPTQRLLALARSGRPLGHFRGGSIKMMRGGYPDLVGIDEPANLPMREYGHGNYVESDGQGDGRSDHVDAKLSPGEFVMDAETTSLLGNGDSDAGARGMEAIRQHIRKEKGKQLAQGKFSPNARKPGYYANLAMKRAK